jgi:hypothetical protein
MCAHSGTLHMQLLVLGLSVMWATLSPTRSLCEFLVACLCSRLVCKLM